MGGYLTSEELLELVGTIESEMVSVAVCVDVIVSETLELLATLDKLVPLDDGRVTVIVMSLSG